MDHLPPTIFCTCHRIDPPTFETALDLPHGWARYITCTACPRTQHTLCVIRIDQLRSIPDWKHNYRCHVCDPASHSVVLERQAVQSRKVYISYLGRVCRRELWPLYCDVCMRHDAPNAAVDIQEIFRAGAPDIFRED